MVVANAKVSVSYREGKTRPPRRGFTGSPSDDSCTGTGIRSGLYCLAVMSAGRDAAQPTSEAAVKQAAVDGVPMADRRTVPASVSVGGNRHRTIPRQTHCPAILGATDRATHTGSARTPAVEVSSPEPAQRYQTGTPVPPAIPVDTAGRSAQGRVREDLEYGVSTRCFRRATRQEGRAMRRLLAAALVCAHSPASPSRTCLKRLLTPVARTLARAGRRLTAGSVLKAMTSGNSCLDTDTHYSFWAWNLVKARRVTRRLCVPAPASARTRDPARGGLAQATR